MPSANPEIRNLIASAPKTGALMRANFKGVTIRAAAAAEGDKPAKLPTFSIVANNGSPMNVGWGLLVVMDMAGMRPLEGAIPSLHGHDTGEIVGHIDTAKADGSVLAVDGTVSGTGPRAVEVVANAANGYPWQASIGANIHKFQELEAGEVADVNGGQVEGPCLIARDWTLKETSFVAIGACEGTSAAISASQKTPSPEKPMSAAAPAVLTAEEIADRNKALRASDAAYLKEKAKIEAAAGGDSAIAAEALEGGWDEARTKDAAELKKLRASQTGTPASTGQPRTNGGMEDADTITAAMLIASGKSEAEVGKLFAAPVMEKAISAGMKNYSIGRLLGEVAAAGGERMHAGRTTEFSLQAALRGDANLRASAGGFSNSNLPGILSNVMYKALLMQYNAASDPWREFCKVGNLTDFKPAYRYRLEMNGSLQKMDGTNELKNVSLTEQGYSVKADTYGATLAVSRQQLINDDLGAIMQAPQAFGNLANATVCKQVYNTLFNPAANAESGNAFWTTSNIARGQNKNKLTGAGSALSFDALTAAINALSGQVDVNGNPIDIGSAMLVIPQALDATAKQLYESEALTSIAATKLPVANIYRGTYKPVKSQWLANAQITGASSTAWFLIADPSMVPSLEVGFLNGQQAPVMQQVTQGADVLGMKWATWLDFGVSPMDPRGAIYNVGA